MLVALRTLGSNAATGAAAPALSALAPACDPPVARERCLAGHEDDAARSSAESSIAPRLVTRPFALRSGRLSVTCTVASVVEKSDPAGAISWCDRLSAFGAIDGAVSAARTDGIGREWSKVGATATRPVSLLFVAPSCVPPARIAGGVESST